VPCTLSLFVYIVLLRVPAWTRLCVKFVLVTSWPVCAAKTAQAEALTPDQKRTLRIRSHMSGLQAHRPTLVVRMSSHFLLIPSVRHVPDTLPAKMCCFEPRTAHWRSTPNVSPACNMHAHFYFRRALPERRGRRGLPLAQDWDA
jgi:hypothetical protein